MLLINKLISLPRVVYKPGFTLEEQYMIHELINEFIPPHLWFQRALTFRKFKDEKDPEKVAGADSKNMTIFYNEKYPISPTVILHEYGHLVDHLLMTKILRKDIDRIFWHTGFMINLLLKIFSRYYEENKILGEYLISLFQKDPLKKISADKKFENCKRSPEETRAEIFRTYIQHGELFREFPKDSPVYKLYELYKEKIFFGIEYERDKYNRPGITYNNYDLERITLLTQLGILI